MFKPAAVTLLCLYSYLAVNAQGPCGLKGSLMDEGAHPAEAMTVFLNIFPDSVSYKTALTDKSGFFEFKNLPKGRYTVTIKAISYQQITKAPV